MTWTRFMDMHSGGGLKEPPYSVILVKGDRDEARRLFIERFGHDPDHVTCECCGDDYSYDSSPTLQVATGHDRGCWHLAAPRNERGRYVQPDDAWWREHQYLEPEDHDEARERGWDPKPPLFHSGEYLTLNQFLALPYVLVVQPGPAPLRGLPAPRRELEEGSAC